MTEREENKITNFNNALKRLTEANIEYKKNKKNDLYRDALIKRFEFTFELSWKCLKEYLEYNGVTVRDTPRDILKTAYQKNLINNEKVWLSMMEDRNLTSHIYKEAQAVAIAEDISMKFCKELATLKVLFEQD